MSPSRQTRLLKKLKKWCRNPDPEDDETYTVRSAFKCFPRKFKLQRSSTSSYEESEKAHGVAELNEIWKKLRLAIKGSTKELVQRYGLRDELEFEKEVKTAYFVHIEVQNKQTEKKAYKETAKKKKRS